MDVLDLTKHLIACPSVTPKDEGAQVLLIEALQDAGFEIFSLPFGEGDEHVPNFFARYGSGAPHICYAGHTDVVPAGDEDAWTYGAFTPTVDDDGVLYGRGASDMKGSVAAFACAAIEYVGSGDFEGSISMLITGDEEGPAINGTVRVLEWMKEHGHIPDMAIVGEPTNPEFLGQEIKIGRRGSLTGFLTVEGVQGHVAYQHLADNPIPNMVKLLDALCSYEFDQGNAFFPPTNLEVSTVDVGNPTTNVIPGQAQAAFNIRYNDQWTREDLIAKIHDILGGTDIEYTLRLEGDAQSFITKPGSWSETVRDAVTEVTGKVPAYTTNGGTSDARFVVQYCPVIECGGVNESIHQVDEHARVEDLKDLQKIFAVVLDKVFKA